MRHIIFQDQPEYPVALLIKDRSLKQRELQEYYLNPLNLRNVDTGQIIAFSLKYDDPKKVKASTQKEYLSELLPELDGLGTKVLLVCDPHYFKTLTKQRKAEPHIGYVLPCAIVGYEDLQVVYAPNYQSLFYSPENQSKLDLALTALADHLRGKYEAPGEGIIHSAAYPIKLHDIEVALHSLHEHSQLTCDIETFSLKFHKAGVGTIAFAWDQHNGVAFRVDTTPDDPNKEVRQLLLEFFEQYQGNLIYHNANFDVKVLIYQLFMAHSLDEKGKQYGIKVMTRKFHDTKLITYLATNSTTGNKLSLKDQAHAFAGNYAQDDIKDITLIQEDKLLEYNLVDCLATWYVFDRHFVTMIEDDQLDIYESVFKPSVQVILQMELTGMPINMEAVAAARKELEAVTFTTLAYFENSPVIQEFNCLLQEQEQTKANAKLKTKVKPIEDFADVVFNPNSAPQLQQFWYDFLDYPVIDKTDKGAPAVGAKTLKKLKHRITRPDHDEILDTLIQFFEANKILNTFIKAIEEHSIWKNGWHYLHGNFNLGGTVSGRLSSSGPNLQNIPSTGSRFAKLIKRCFQAPPGWLFMGADFASLEDRISALTTKDPNKLKVYTDGYDGHCLRAYAYFKDEMPDIVLTVESINSIAKKYPEIRQRSKAPTFLLTYGGTYHGLIQNVGLEEEEAKAIEANYHEMYKASDLWVKDKIDNAAKDGYVTTAFGLRVRTPTLKQSLMNSRITPYEAQAEARTAGNALGQSYGLLNNRAGIELQCRVMKSPYRYDVLPVAHIHDAQYFLVRDDIDVITYLNKNLVECMEWQQLPEIIHPDVGLGGELSVFHPTWETEYSLPNNGSQNALRNAANPPDSDAA